MGAKARRAPSSTSTPGESAMSTLFRTPNRSFGVLATIACAALLCLATSAASAEVAAVGEPFPIADQLGVATALDLAWLPPGAGADQPAGFLVVALLEGFPAADRRVLRAFVPEDPAGPPVPAVTLAGPGRPFAPHVAVGNERRATVAFAAQTAPCYGGLVLGPGLTAEAALEPVEDGPCSLPFLDVAVLPDGGIVVVYERQTGQFAIDLVAQHFTPQGEPESGPVRLGPGNELQRLRGVVPAPGGYLLFSALLDNALDQFTPGTLRVQHFAPDGEPLAPAVELRDAPRHIVALSVVPVAGGFVAVWSEQSFFDATGFITEAFGRRLGPTGEPAGPVVPLLADVESTDLGAPDAAPGPGGTVLLAWSQAVDGGSDLRAQLRTAELAPAGEAVTLISRPPESSRFVGLAAGPAGDALAVWIDDGTLRGQRLTATGECTPSDTVLCLQGGRFEVSVEWADFEGNSGSGRRVPVASDDSGLFWFFHPDNWEMLVKMIDGCPLNDRFWVFAAAATNVEYTLTVSDLVAHQTRVFRNDLGDTARALTATDAFATCEAAAP
jgi:hypothetical protein